MPIDPEVKKALDLRLAKGEITPEEYRQRFALLEDTTPTHPPTPDPKIADEYTLSTHEAAQAIGVTRGTLQGYITSGRLQTNPDGTIDTAALHQAGFIVRNLPHTEFTPQTAPDWTAAKPQKARSSSKAGIGCLSVIVIFFILYLIGSFSSDSQKTKTTAPRTQEEIRKEQIEKNFSAWDGSHRGLTELIKKSMNDPASYDHVETVYWDKGEHLVVKTTFRGKNAFGGVVKNWVMAKVDLNGNVIEVISQGP